MVTPPTPPASTADTADTDPSVWTNPLALPPTGTVDNGRFATSGACASCHSNHPSATAMRDVNGQGVAPYDLWQASMMANAARDPVWRAVVSAEIAATPGAAALIGERCMNCHAPMAATDASLVQDGPPGLSTLTAGTERSNLALDGASCTLCHQIEPDNLGQTSSWKGNYIVRGDQKAYGPHSNPNTAYMGATGWIPTEGDHSTTPELCATCHTLITEALEPDGTPNGGSLVEQSPFLEMRNSESANSSCQNCHMPPFGAGQASILTRIARQESGADYADLPNRSMTRHLLVGGNTLVPQLFREFHDVLQPNAPPEAFDAKIVAARAQLQTNTASVFVQNAQKSGNSLTFRARVDLRTGHKFPTGIPLRRAWLKATVRDGTGTPVFTSGGYDSQGRILASAGVLQSFEQAGGPIAPHRDMVVAQEEVVVYEAVMKDLSGAPTFLLLRGAGWLKDNRLLPPGWSPANQNIALIAPAGVEDDLDYTTGGDLVDYTVDVSGRTGPFTVELELLYQPVSARYAEELFTADTPETRALRDMLEAVDRRPEIVAVASASVAGP